MDTPDLGAFGKYVPGFEFLQNLAKQATGGAASALPGHWVAPTFNVEDLDKRIQELKTVHFWLDQNAKALSATIQALEVQRMTLATLQGMNVRMGDVAEALKVKPAPAPEAAAPAPAPEAAADEGASGAAAVDPMQWWNALTQQFQTIADHAIKDMAAHAAQVTQAAAEAGAAVATPTAAAAKRATSGRQTTGRSNSGKGANKAAGQPTPPRAEASKRKTPPKGSTGRART